MKISCKCRCLLFTSVASTSSVSPQGIGSCLDLKNGTKTRMTFAFDSRRICNCILPPSRFGNSRVLDKLLRESLIFSFLRANGLAPEKLRDKRLKTFDKVRN